MPKVSSIGVAYQISQSDFPLDKYDLPLGEIITELGIVTRSTE
jgi:5-formyltetrahydrofolate cyclo-ligase